MEKTVEEIKQELEENGQRVDSVNVLFLDVSSACTGYCVASVDFNKKNASINKAGAIWLNDNWTHAAKFSYLGNSISNYFWVVEKIDYIVAEQYSVSGKKQQGTLVVPEAIGAIKAYSHDTGGINIETILPQSWRSILGIKPESFVDKHGRNRRDYKKPTKEEVKNRLSTEIPEKMISNITNKERNTPTDVYDAIGLSLAWLNRLNFRHIDTNNVTFNHHLGVLEGV